MSGARTAPPLPSERKFGLFFAAICLAFAVHRQWHARPTAAAWLLAAAVVLAALALLAPRLLRPFNRAWPALGLLMGRIVNPVVLTVLFFLVVTPYALVLRWTGRDPLRLRRDPATDSYWIERDPPGPAPDFLHRQF